MIRVMIVEDHTLVREGLKKLLSMEPDIVVVGEAGDAEHALGILEEARPDILMLDLSLPGRSGIELLVDLKQRFPDVKVLVLSMFPEESWGIRALKSGAAGYLGKHAVPDELPAALRRIAAGRKYISPLLAERLADELGKPEVSHGHERLSQREFEVMLLIAGGKQPKEIAEILLIGDRTVGTYRRRILEKLQLNSTADIVHYVIQHDLLPA